MTRSPRRSYRFPTRTGDSRFDGAPFACPKRPSYRSPATPCISPAISKFQTRARGEPFFLNFQIIAQGEQNSDRFSSTSILPKITLVVGYIRNFYHFHVTFDESDVSLRPSLYYQRVFRLFARFSAPLLRRKFFEFYSRISSRVLPPEFLVVAIHSYLRI